MSVNTSFGITVRSSCIWYLAKNVTYAFIYVSHLAKQLWLLLCYGFDDTVGLFASLAPLTANLWFLVSMERILWEVQSYRLSNRGINEISITISELLASSLKLTRKREEPNYWKRDAKTSAICLDPKIRVTERQSGTALPDARQHRY